MSKTELDYRVFTATRPGVNPDVPAGYEALAWVANSATLIYGDRDAVLVDTFFTLEHSAKLADQIAATGKNLTSSTSRTRTATTSSVSTC